MRRSRLFLVQTGVLLSLLIGLLAWSSYRTGNDEANRLPQQRQLLSVLGLTDFALWSEARYTRHPSQADLFTPFQDFPSSLEHFPAGSLLAPAAEHLTTRLEIRHKGAIRKEP